MSDGYDPDHYETKKNRAHIERVMLMRECGVGLMPYCPCGDALKEQFYEGEKYWMCEKYKFDTFLHYRVRWDTAVTEDIERLKEMNEEQDKALRELRFELEQTKREMRADKEAKTKEVEEVYDCTKKKVYDLLRQMPCGCEGCKQNVENASHKNM